MNTPQHKLNKQERLDGIAHAIATGVLYACLGVVGVTVATILMMMI